MYRHLSSSERYIIEMGSLLGKSSRDIAFVLGRHHSSVARELVRGVPEKRWGYSRLIAEGEYRSRRLKGGPRRMIRGALRRHIVAKIHLHWSPEQIVGRAHLQKQCAPSVETIYRFIYQDKLLGGELWKNLRLCRPKRKRRFPRHTWRKLRPGLELRPASANTRTRLGHFERDLVEGPRNTQSALLTIVDRKSRLVKIQWLRRRWATEVHAATIKALQGHRVNSITNDNGLEFSSFKKTAKALKTKIFFTRPYASWERGSIENMNGLIRQYFPKKANLHDIKKADLRRVQRLLNERPRKTLGFLSPSEVHRKISS